MKFSAFLISIFLCSSAFADNLYILQKNNQPYDYSINMGNPNGNSSAVLSGMAMGAMAQQGAIQREQREIQKNKIKREEDYRAELKKFYDKPETLNNENLVKLMILYPEFQETTLKIQDSYNKLAANKEQK